MIISIVVTKSFSTGLLLQFTFSYSITTAKIELYVSDMFKKNTHSRHFLEIFRRLGHKNDEECQQEKCGKDKTYGFQLSDWLEAMFSRF